MGENCANRSSKLNVGIDAISYCLGSELLTNADLKRENPRWDMESIIQRTGVMSRPIAAPFETALDMAENAAQALIEKMGLSINKIDALIFCTQTPDHVLPPNSVLLHGRLSMSQSVMAFDISHACSGFIYGLGIGRSLVQSGTAKRVLLINADTYTRLLHPQDRSTRPIFGDGAAATLISNFEPTLTVLDMKFETSGKNAERFIVKSGGARHPMSQSDVEVFIDKSGRVRSNKHISMDGLGVLSFFTSVVPHAVQEIMVRNQIKIEDVSLFVFHQASKLALEGLQRSLAIPKENMVIDLQETGNLVSASIPVALARVMDRRRLQVGQLAIVCGFGVGLSWGVALIRFEGDKN